MQATDCTIIKAFPAEEQVYRQTFGTVLCHNYPFSRLAEVLKKKKKDKNQHCFFVMT